MKIPKTGNTDFYSKTKVVDGLYIVERYKVETSKVQPIEDVTGDAVITHTGAYGRIKFIFEGETYTSESSPDYFKNIDGTSCLAIGPSGRVIRIDKLTFDRKQPEELHGIYIKNTKTTDYWISIGNFMSDVSGKPIWRPAFTNYK